MDDEMAMTEPAEDSAAETDGRRLRRIEGRALLFDEAMRRYHAGEPIDLATLASENDVGRSSAYRWFGSNDGLLAEIVRARQAENFANVSRLHVRKRGRSRVVAVLVDFLQHAADSERFVALLDREPKRALAIATSSRHPNQAELVGLIEDLLEREAARGLHLPMDAPTLAYTIAKLVEAFLYGDIAAGEGVKTDRAAEVFTKLLGGGR